MAQKVRKMPRASNEEIPPRGNGVSSGIFILKCIAQALLYCGKQGIALRGDKESVHETGNPGNFIALLKLISQHYDTLKKHLQSPQLKCVTYKSPQTQNEVLDIIANHIILRDLVAEMKQAKLYSIMADVVTSHNT